MYREAVTPQSPGLLQPGWQRCREFNPERVAADAVRQKFAPYITDKRRNRVAVEILLSALPRVEATLGFGP